MTSKQKLFVKAKLDNPKISNTAAALESYDTTDRQVAAVIGNQLMNKPEILMALGEHSDLFESVIVGAARDWASSETPRKREIALNAAMFGHDKVHGKSTVRIEQQTSVVRININLAGDDDSMAPDDLLDE